MAKLLNFTDLNVQNMTYSDPKSIGSGNFQTKLIYVNFEGKGSTLLQTPKMKMPFGISKFQYDKSLPAKYTLSLSFEGIKEDSNMKNMLDKINDIENKIKSDIIKNSVAWMNKKVITRETVNEIFSSSIKFSKDKDTGERNTRFAPTIQLKMPYFNDKFSTTIFDADLNEVDVDDDAIPKGSYGTAILKCNGIWTSTNKFGLTWKVEQIKLETHNNTHKEKTNVAHYAFLDED
jgi:hypothetical protein